MASSCEVYTFGLLHIGLGASYRDKWDDDVVRECFLQKFKGVMCPRMFFDCRRGFNDGYCPSGHAGTHVEFVGKVVYTERFAELVKAVKRAFLYYQRVNKVADGDTFAMGFYCKQGCHRSVCVGRVFAWLSALNVI